MEKFEMPEPMNPRDSFYRCCTSATRSRYTAGDNEEVFYIDVTFLYLYIMCHPRCFYPLGHPEIFHSHFENPQNYVGFICAKVYPPCDLFFPMLPLRTSKGKLLFTLGRLCSELNHQTGPCTHNDEEKALTGVWTTPEKTLQNF